MRKSLIFFSIIMFIYGCNPVPKDKQRVAKINDYEITLDEFREEFKESSFAREETPESRKEFLNNLISRKLILEDAQGKGMDKERAFLKMIEKFWEQSLCKLAIDRKTKEITGLVAVSDKEIEDAYNNMAKEGKADKPFDQMYHEIKWEMSRVKQTQQLNDWVAQLQKNADIKVNYELLRDEVKEK